MKKIILIIFLLIVSINNSNGVYYKICEKGENNLNIEKYDDNEITKCLKLDYVFDYTSYEEKYSITTDEWKIMPMWRDKGLYKIIDKNWKNIKSIVDNKIDWHYLSLLETKYHNHIFYEYNVVFNNFIEEQAEKNYLNYMKSDDWKKDFHLGAYVDKKRLIKYNENSKNNLIQILKTSKISYYRVEDILPMFSYWTSWFFYRLEGKYEKWIFLRKKHLEYLDKLLKRIPEKKYGLVLNKLDELIEKFDKRKDYKWKYLLEALTYLYSEIKIEQLKIGQIKFD